MTEAPDTVGMAKSDNPFRWFDSSPEVIQMVVMLYVRFPLSLRNVRSYRTAMKQLGNQDRQEVGRWLNNRAENGTVS